MLNKKFPNGKIGYSYHNHSTFSDGRNTPEEMLLAARAAGIREYGFSDHWVVLPESQGENVRWGIPKERINEYLDTVKALKEKYTDDSFSVKVGLEVDYYDENITEVAHQLRSFELDYVIGASHFYGTFSIDGGEGPWTELNQEQIDEVISGYWGKIERLTACGVFDIVAHADLCKIYGYRSSVDTFPRALNVLAAARDNGVAVEINTAGWDKKCGICYPDPKIIKTALDMGVHIVVSADAHMLSHINRHFDEAEALLRGE